MSTTKAAIVVCLSSTFQEIKHSIKSSFPLAWFDNEEIEGLVLTLIKNTLTGIFSSFDPRTESIAKQCYQGNIDYLEYSGLSQEGAFRASHIAEMNILKAIVDTYPKIDDKELVKILEYHFKDNSDLYIICEIENETNSYYTNRPYTGIV